ncbi:FAD-binding protein, partial [Escherichia coli]|uniref:FAD-binding protein n=1 Tax=Escherichia coli TaxID=562 RepID=UPI0010CAE501
EMTQLELWGCPWSRRPDGSVNVRRFRGMKIERTWFAADHTGFHLLPTLFPTSPQFPHHHRLPQTFLPALPVAYGSCRAPVCTYTRIRTRGWRRAKGGGGGG